MSIVCLLVKMFEERFQVLHKILIQGLDGCYWWE